MTDKTSVNVSRVYGKGTVHIPQFVREALEIQDGDVLLWAVENGFRAVFTRADIKAVTR